MLVPKCKHLQNRLKDLQNLITYEDNSSDMKQIEEVCIREGIKFENLESLVLRSNQLYEIGSSFLLLSKLIILDLSHNQIQSVEFLYNCSNLEFLNLSHNKIKTIGLSLSGMKKLLHCDLSFNLIQYDNSVVKYFKFNNELISLCLQGNPKYNWECCKFICLETLENLGYLDNKEIFRKVIKKQLSSYTTIKTEKGETKQIRSIKEYIKLRLNDITEKGKIRSPSSSKFKGCFKSSYYYLNK